MAGCTPTPRRTASSGRRTRLSTIPLKAVSRLAALSCAPARESRRVQVVCWTSYCFVCASSLRMSIPECLQMSRSASLERSHGLVRVFHVCLQNRFSTGFQCSAQHTVGGQQLGINVSAHQYSERKQHKRSTCALRCLPSVSVIVCLCCFRMQKARKSTQNVLRRRRNPTAPPPFPHTHTHHHHHKHTIFSERTQHNTLESKLHEKIKN